MKSNIDRSKELFATYIQYLNEYDPRAYDLLSDEAEVTSTRRKTMTLRWKGREFRELILPSQKEAQKEKKEYTFENPIYSESDGVVSLTCSFPPTSLGQEGILILRMKENDSGAFEIIELHDGYPVEKAVRLEKVSQSTDGEGNIDIQLRTKRSNQAGDDNSE